MDELKLRETISLAIRQASGKTHSGATNVITEAVKSFLETADTFTVEEEHPPSPEAPPMPPAIMATPEEVPVKPVPGGELRELKPVATATSPGRQSAARKHRDITDIQTTLMADAPATIEVIPEGRVDTLTLERMITNDQQSGSVQLAYRPRKMEPGVPYPKTWFWDTDVDPPDIPAALEDMKTQAVSMFRLRRGPITTHAQTMAPLSQRLNNGGTV